MTLKELKEFLNDFPEELDKFNIVNGEYGVLTEEEIDKIRTE